MEKLIIILGKLRAAGLKVNAPKCSFEVKKIPFLCYVIPREGIKLKPKEVQDIMDLVLPTITTETQELTGMMQYYRYNMFGQR